MYFHDIIKKYQGKTKDDLKDLEICPLNAGIHPAGSKANIAKPAYNQRPKVMFNKQAPREEGKGKGTPEDITGTPEVKSVTTLSPQAQSISSGITPTPPKPALPGSSPSMPIMVDSLGMPIGPMTGQTHYNPQIPAYNYADPHLVNAFLMGSAAMMPIFNQSPTAYLRNP